VEPLPSPRQEKRGTAWPSEVRGTAALTRSAASQLIACRASQSLSVSLIRWCLNWATNILIGGVRHQGRCRLGPIGGGTPVGLTLVNVNYRAQSTQ
jgi:hypothetical protein